MGGSRRGRGCGNVVGPERGPEAGVHVIEGDFTEGAGAFKGGFAFESLLRVGLGGFGGGATTAVSWDELPTTIDSGIAALCSELSAECDDSVLWWDLPSVAHNPILWEHLPNIMELGIIELKGSNLECLRASQHIELRLKS